MQTAIYYDREFPSNEIEPFTTDNTIKEVLIPCQYGIIAMKLSTDVYNLLHVIFGAFTFDHNDINDIKLMLTNRIPNDIIIGSICIHI